MPILPFVPNPSSSGTLLRLAHPTKLVCRCSYSQLTTSQHATSFVVEKLRVLQSQEVLHKGHQMSLFTPEQECSTNPFDSGEMGKTTNRTKWFLSPAAEIPFPVFSRTKGRKAKLHLRSESPVSGIGKWEQAYLAHHRPTNQDKNLPTHSPANA